MLTVWSVDSANIRKNKNKKIDKMLTVWSVDSANLRKNKNK